MYLGLWKNVAGNQSLNTAWILLPSYNLIQNKIQILDSLPFLETLKPEQRNGWVVYHMTPCCCSVAQSCLTLCDPMDCSMPGFPVLHHLPEFAQTHIHWVSDAIQPSHPLSSLLPSVFPSIRVFSNESALRIRRLKYWSSSFSLCPSNKYSRLISFRIDWLDILAVHGTLKDLLLHHNLKASVLWCSAFFMVQLSHPSHDEGKPQLWLNRPLLAKWCLCFLIRCLGLP